MDSLRLIARRVHYFVTKATLSRRRDLRRYSQNFIDNWTRNLNWRKQRVAREAERLLRASENGLLTEQEMKRLTCKLLAQLMRVFTDEDTVNVERVGGAMTNRVYIVSSPGNDTVLLRLYGRGTDVLFDRQRELDTFRTLSDRSFGPKLLGTFSGGRLEEFIVSTTLKKNDLCNPTTSAEIGAVMAQLHQLKVSATSSENKSELWAVLDDWCSKAVIASQNVNNNPCVVRTGTWDVSALVQSVKTEIVYLSAQLQKTASPVVFCHNDAQYGNIIRRHSDGKIMLIDYEYARYNYRGFDLGNHFCEWAADYDAVDAHRLYFDRYPTREQQMIFIDAYLHGIHPTFDQLSQGAQAAEREALYIEANQYGLASHLQWCLWGIIQASNSTIEFNFLEYSAQRFQEYQLRRDEHLAMSPPVSPLL